MVLNLPSLAVSPGVIEQTDGKFTIYVRCQDKGGQANAKDYFIRFTVVDELDLTPPLIELTSLIDGSQLPFNTTETPFTIYTNEPAECKYTIGSDVPFDAMEKTFDCATTETEITPIAYGLYKCDTTLEELTPNADNNIYIRCKDQPLEVETKRNANTDSLKITLKPSDPLEIISTSPPKGEIFTDVPELVARTDKGAERDGTAQCAFSTNQVDYVLFLQTNSSEHKQPLGPLNQGDYKFFVQCLDIANNIDAAEIEFTVSVDNYAPKIVSVTTDRTSASPLLSVKTDEPSTCEYSTTGRFSVGNGQLMTGTNTKEHTSLLNSEIFYIRCKDASDNQGSLIELFV